MEENFDISTRLKALRSLAKLSQEEFAEAASLSYKHYQNIESGRKKLVRIDTIKKFCYAYNIELWQFFHPEIPKIDISKKSSSSPHYKK